VGEQVQPVRVPAGIYRGLMAVRHSGRTNMLEVGMVQHVANELGYHDAAGWIEENRSAYIRGVYNGFEVADMVAGEG
jgi:Domain of unknown function (DUF5049)